MSHRTERYRKRKPYNKDCYKDGYLALIERTHKEVNRMRVEQGLEPYFEEAVQEREVPQELLAVLERSRLRVREITDDELKAHLYEALT